MALRDGLFDEEDAEKLQFLSKGCGIQYIWGIRVGNWVGLPDEASCRPAPGQGGPGARGDGPWRAGPGARGDRPWRAGPGPRGDRPWRGGLAALPAPGDSRADGLSLHVRRAGAA